MNSPKMRKNSTDCWMSLNSSMKRTMTKPRTKTSWKRCLKNCLKATSWNSMIVNSMTSLKSMRTKNSTATSYYWNLKD